MPGVILGTGSASTVTNDSGVSGATVKDALNTLAAVDATKAPLFYTINAQTGTSYTLVDAVVGQMTTLSNPGAIAVSVPGTLTVGGVFAISVIGGGQVTFTGTAGLTVQPPIGMTAKSRTGGTGVARLTVEILSATLAVLSGDVSPV